MNVQSFCARDTIACIKLRGADRADARTPVHFCVLCDVSGSMEDDNKIENIKKSLDYIVTILTKNDYMSIVVFNNRGTCIQPRVLVTEENMMRIQQQIKTMIADGGTNLSDGLFKAKNCLADVGLAEHKQGILLLTDGHVNEGIKDNAGLVGIVQAIMNDHKGITISTVGYGTTHNGDLLREIATHGGGSYNLVENAEHVASVFGDILGGLVSCTHKNITIKIPEGASQITTFPIEDGHIQVGDLRANTDVTVLIKDCPVDTELIIKGYDLGSTAFIEQTVKVTITEDNTLLLHGVIAILRSCVVQIMEQVRQAVMNRQVSDVRARLLTEIQRQRESIQLQVSVGGENPVLGMLLEELTTCETTLNTHINSHHAYEHATQILSQHVTHVALGRGIRHNATPGRPDVETAPSPYTNVFSNGLQRTISNAIRSGTGATTTVTNPIPAPSASQSMDLEEILTQLLDDPCRCHTPTES
jgi:Mg-chelatase subunit ChlD